MDKVLYAQLIALLDVYESQKRNSSGSLKYGYYSGACDALRKLKRKFESYETERT